MRLTEEQERARSLRAQAEGVRKQKATARAITETASRKVRDDRVRALSREGRTRYADLLDRLARS